MRTFSEIQTDIGDEFNETDTGRIQRLVNRAVKNIRAETGWNWDEKVDTALTVASQQEYTLPVDVRMLKSVQVTVGSVVYTLRPIFAQDQWDRLTDGVTATTTSDIGEYFFFDKLNRGQIKIWPTPSSSGNTITYKYHTQQRHLDSADFIDKSTGTASISSGAMQVTGVTTAFAATDVGRYIRFDDDGFWYKITGFTSTTVIDIDRDFEGATVSSSNFLIGTLPDIPSEGDELIDFWVLTRLWRKREDFSVSGGKATAYETRYDDGIKKLRMIVKMLVDDANVTVIDPDVAPMNPNNFPTGLSN